MTRIAIRWRQDSDTAQPFERSIGLMLALVSRNTAADSCFLYAYEENGLTLRQTHGNSSRRLQRADIELPVLASARLTQSSEPIVVDSDATADPLVSNFPEVLLNGFSSFAVIILNGENSLAGILTLGWKQREAPIAETVKSLEEIGRVLTLLLTRRQAPSELAERVTQLQAELADRKIADRVSGLFNDRVDSAEVVKAHVDKVLSGFDLHSELARRAVELEDQIANREVLVQAKLLLQNSHGFSEEQAYIHLRNESRRSRQPLRNIALAIVQQYSREMIRMTA